jgi:predicted glycosyltransferase
VAAKTRFTGYLDPSTHRRPCEPALEDLVAGLGAQRVALCLVGGGQDGGPLAEAFVAGGVPPDMQGVVLTGPFMPLEQRRQLQARIAGSRRLRILEFLGDPSPLVDRADRIVSMGGYNTLCEALAARKPVLVVPRSTPRSEQLMRARRFAELGLLQALLPEQMLPGAIRTWLMRPAPLPVSARERIDFNGLSRIPELLDDLTRERPAEDAKPQTRAGSG